MNNEVNTFKAEPREVIAPDQIVSALIRADSVLLKGFASTPASSFLMPVVRSMDPAQSAPAARKASLITSRLGFAGIAVVVLCCSALAFWAGRLSDAPPGQASAAAAPTWMARAVKDSGVSLVMGSATLVIPVGAMLPSGEILRGINVSQQSYFTDTQVTVVKNNE